MFVDNNDPVLKVFLSDLLVYNYEDLPILADWLADRSDSRERHVRNFYDFIDSQFEEFDRCPNCYSTRLLHSPHGPYGLQFRVCDSGCAREIIPTSHWLADNLACLFGVFLRKTPLRISSPRNWRWLCGSEAHLREHPNATLPSEFYWKLSRPHLGALGHGNLVSYPYRTQKKAIEDLAAAVQADLLFHEKWLT